MFDQIDQIRQEQGSRIAVGGAMIETEAQVHLADFDQVIVGVEFGSFDRSADP